MTEDQKAMVGRNFREWIDVGTRVAFPILLAYVGWDINSNLDYDRRLTTIEASRYTAQEAALDKATLTQQLNDLEVGTTEIATTARATKERLDRIDAKLDRLLEGK